MFLSKPYQNFDKVFILLEFSPLFFGYHVILKP